VAIREELEDLVHAEEQWVDVNSGYLHAPMVMDDEDAYTGLDETVLDETMHITV